MVNIFNLIHPNKVYTEEEFSALIDSGLKKDAQAYKDFIETYDEKIKVIREFEQLWDSDTLKKTVHRFKDIKGLNDKIIKQLNTLTVDISRQSEITRSFLYKVLKKKLIEAREDLPKEEQKKDYDSQLKYFIARINDDLKIISDLLKQQNDYIKKNEEWKTMKELREHGNFFKLLHDESVKKREIEYNIIIIIKYLKNISKTEGYEDIDEILKRVRFAKAYPYSNDLRKFYYGVYIEKFPDPGERESWEVINLRIQQGRYHVIVAKVDDEIIGGVVSCFLTYNNLTWGIIYWICVVEKLREKGFKFVGSRLAREAVKDMSAMASYGLLDFGGVFAELNDPEKMTKQQIKDDAMDPYKRLAFWNSVGLKRVFKGYVQLTSDPNAFVYYCSLYVLPLSDKWSKEIPKDDLKTFLLGNAILGCGFTEEGLRTYKPWLDMMKEFDMQERFLLE